MFGGTDTNYVTVRRNRIDYAGSGAIAWMWGVGNVAELNRISHSGMLIIDNEGIQVLRHGKAATSRQHSRSSLAPTALRNSPLHIHTGRHAVEPRLVPLQLGA